MTVNCLSGLGSRRKNSSRSPKPAMPSCSPRMIIVGTSIRSGLFSGSFEHMSTYRGGTRGHRVVQLQDGVGECFDGRLVGRPGMVALEDAVDERAVDRPAI